MRTFLVATSLLSMMAAASAQSWGGQNRAFPSFSPEAVAERANAQKRSEDLHARGEKIAKTAVASICRGCTEEAGKPRAEPAAFRHEVRVRLAPSASAAPKFRLSIADRQALLDGYLTPGLDW